LVHGFVGLDIFPPLAFQSDNNNRSILDFSQFLLENLLEIERKMTGGREAPEYTREEMVERMMVGRLRQGGLTREGCDMLIDRGSIVQPNGKLRFSHDPRGQGFFFAGLISLASNVRIYARNIACPTHLIDMYISTEPRSKELSMIKSYTNTVSELKDTIRKSVPKLEISTVETTHHGHMLNPEIVSPIVISFLESNN